MAKNGFSSSHGIEFPKKNHQLNNQNPKDNPEITTTFGNFWILKLPQKIIQSIHPPKFVEGKFQVPIQKNGGTFVFFKTLLGSNKKTGAGSKASTVQKLRLQTFWGFQVFRCEVPFDGQNAIFLVNI